MRRPHPPRSVRVQVSAKVNLAWAVGDVRPDGYHEVSGLMQTIGLHDVLEVTAGEPVGGEPTVLGPGRVPFGLQVEGAERIDAGVEDNLVTAAARALAELVEPRPCTVRLTKSIPAGAGLGGGSADAAGALTGLCLAWTGRLQSRLLRTVAASIGSDVPAILAGGLVAATGRGEQVRRIGSADGTWLVLGVADRELSTPQIYARLDELRVGGLARTPAALGCNDLQAAALQAAPELRQGLEAIGAAGALAAFVTGSGPTLVGVARDREHAGRMAGHLSGAFRKAVAVEAVGWGVRLSAGSRPARSGAPHRTPSADPEPEGRRPPAP